jgi:hypothetical protein
MVSHMMLIIPSLGIYNPYNELFGTKYLIARIT